MRKLTMEELNRKSVSQFKDSEKIPIVVVLDNIRSMHNVGSVFRTSDAFLIERMFLCGYTPQPPHRDIQKTALGATDTVKWDYVEQTTEAISQLKALGYLVYAIEQAHLSVPLHSFSLDPGQKLAVVFGNEVTGVADDVLALCDGCLEIPQLGMKHSLNISVAAGIVLWELVRSRLSFQLVSEG
ncbi:RNA methyltransferase [Flavitalea antarctica]